MAETTKESPEEETLKRPLGILPVFSEFLSESSGLVRCSFIQTLVAHFRSSAKTLTGDNRKCAYAQIRELPGPQYDHP